jgi:hypothetical protein
MAGGCTLSVDPQEGTGLFPILEDVALSEPHGGAFVTGVIRRIEVYEWIWRRKPVCKVFAQIYNVLEQLISYKDLSLTANDKAATRLRTLVIGCVFH